MLVVEISGFTVPFYFSFIGFWNESGVWECFYILDYLISINLKPAILRRCGLKDFYFLLSPCLTLALKLATDDPSDRWSACPAVN